MKKINLALIASALVPALALAEETTAAAHTATGSGVGTAAFGAAMCMGLAAGAVGLGQSRAAAAALEGIARNPGSSNKVFVPLLLSLAFMEALGLFALLISQKILGG
jgi:F-type H+-transporting ATPase subunit c